MILSVNELCKYLGISRTTEYNLRKKNGPPFFKVGSRVLYRKEDVDEWMKNGGTNHDN